MMQLNFPIPTPTPVELGRVQLGSIVYQLDSGEGAQSLSRAIIEPGENFFIVCEEKKEISQPPSSVLLASIDGKFVYSRQRDRLVSVHDIESVDFTAWEEKTLSSLEPGVVVVRGLDPKSLMTKKKKQTSDPFSHLFLIARVTPEITRMTSLVSFTGEVIRLDSDRKVTALKNFSLNVSFGD